MGAKKVTPADPIRLTSAALNEASDRLSQIVLQIEAALSKLNLGIQCWLPEPLATTMETDDRGNVYRHVKSFGYGRVEKKWGLAILHEYDDETENVQFLRDCSREDRLLALQRIDELIAALLGQANEQMKRISVATEKAERVLKQLEEAAGPSGQDSANSPEDTPPDDIPF